MDGMKGNICIVSDNGWAVSNDATLDYHKERVDTPDGPRMVGYSVFEAANPFSTLDEGDNVKVAFQAEDGNNVSYAGVVEKATDSRLKIKVVGQINEYKQIIERVLSWQQ